MHCNVPRVGQLVGVEVTVTVTVVIIVVNSGDAKRNKEQLSHEALATYSDMKEQLK